LKIGYEILVNIKKKKSTKKGMLIALMDFKIVFWEKNNKK